MLTEDPVPPTRLQPRVSRDLETICLKCLQKEPGRRYVGADALALDLQRFLSGRPILARPVPAWERVAKWTRRRPAVAVLIGFSVVATVALFALSLAHNARLRHERAIASAERDAARKAQQQSEADFGLALDAVKRFYTEVSENKLLLVPTMDTVRIELLERAREFYERIARERPDDSNVQAELGRTIWRLAVMVGNSRSVPEGIGLMEQSIAIQERLVHQYPDRPEYRSDLARSFNNLGIMHRSNSQRALGAEDWKRSLALREQLVREQPEDFLSRRDLAQSLQNLGNWYREGGGHDEQVEEVYRRALAIQNALAREAPDAARPGLTSPSRHSLWTRPASATISRLRTLTWGASTLTLDSLPKRPRPSSKRSTTWTGWFASNRAGPATDSFCRRRTTSSAVCINPMARSLARPRHGTGPENCSRCWSASIRRTRITDTTWP